MKEAGLLINKIYFAAVSAITIFMLMWSVINLLDMGLKTWVFPLADAPDYIENCSQMEYPTEEAKIDIKSACEQRNQNALENYQREKAQNAVRYLSILIVTLPLFILHFKVILKDRKKTN
ncbi:hypothetical protein D6827_01245 [Candidatus Parcubacteria bacterium]|nr:MAG: hypothetical protein D6827_01245 [Candidatus Parcubacteria bacterium]